MIGAADRSHETFDIGRRLDGGPLHAADGQRGALAATVACHAQPERLQTCALGMGGQIGGMVNEAGHFGVIAGVESNPGVDDSSVTSATKRQPTRGQAFYLYEEESRAEWYRLARQRQPGDRQPGSLVSLNSMGLIGVCRRFTASSPNGHRSSKLYAREALRGAYQLIKSSGLSKLASTTNFSGHVQSGIKHSLPARQGGCFEESQAFAEIVWRRNPRVRFLKSFRMALSESLAYSHLALFVHRRPEVSTSGNENPPA